HRPCTPLYLPSFPTRRSSDLRVEGRVDRRVEADREVGAEDVVVDRPGDAGHLHAVLGGEQRGATKRAVSADDDQPFDSGALQHGDRKSTRLNSSHVSISYAVF